MFPFGHPAGMPFHPLGLPFPCSGHDMRKQYIAVMHGRKEGYVAAMKDVRGAERVADFVDRERQREFGAHERARSHKEPDQVLRIKIEHDSPGSSKAGSTTSGGTAVTEDAFAKYLVHKAKHEEYSRLLKGSDTKTSKSSKDTKTSKASKPSESTGTSSTSSSDSSRRHKHGHHHHQHRHSDHHHRRLDSSIPSSRNSSGRDHVHDFVRQQQMQGPPPQNVWIEQDGGFAPQQLVQMPMAMPPQRAWTEPGFAPHNMPPQATYSATEDSTPRQRFRGGGQFDQGHFDRFQRPHQLGDRQQEIREVIREEFGRPVRQGLREGAFRHRVHFEDVESER